MLRDEGAGSKVRIRDGANNLKNEARRGLQFACVNSVQLGWRLIRELIPDGLRERLADPEEPIVVIATVVARKNL